MLIQRCQFIIFLSQGVVSYRMWRSIQSILKRGVPSSLTSLDFIEIVSHSNVSHVNHLYTLSLALHWGHNVAEFKPERFIDTASYRWPRDACELMTFSPVFASHH